MNETINQRIKRLRKAKGYRQEDVAKLLNLKTSTYSQMERKGGITSDIIFKLSEVLETKPLILLYGENYFKKSDKDLPKIKEKMKKEIDIPEIPFIITKNVREKLVLIAMRRLTDYDNKEIYNFVLEKLKSL